MKLGFAITIFVSAVAGYRDLETMDQIVFYFVVVGALTSIVEVCLIGQLGSRYYLIRKMKRRFGYHPAPFEVIVPTALSYNQRRHMQQAPDHDTDEELSGLDESGSSSSGEEEKKGGDDGDVEDKKKEESDRRWWQFWRGRNSGGETKEGDNEKE